MGYSLNNVKDFFIYVYNTYLLSTAFCILLCCELYFTTNFVYV